MVLYLNKKHTLKVCLPIEQDRLQKILICIVAWLSVSALLLGSVAIAFFVQIKHITLEAGDSLSVSDATDIEGAVFSGFDPAFTSKPGVYYFTLIADGKEREVRLKVVDTKAPDVKVKEVKCAIGCPLPLPEDFIDTVYEADSYKGEYITPFAEIDRMGEFEAQIMFCDPSGNKTDVIDVKMSVISDNEAPNIKLIREKVVLSIGQKEDLLQYVSVSDNCVGEIKLEVDDSRVNYGEEGKYTVTYTASDASGNVSRVDLVLLIEKNDVE